MWGRLLEKTLRRNTKWISCGDRWVRIGPIRKQKKESSNTERRSFDYLAGARFKAFNHPTIVPRV